MSRYVHTLALIGTLLTPAILHSAAPQPTANEIVRNQLYIHINNLIDSAEFLQKLLQGSVEAFTEGLQRLTPEQKQHIEELCEKLSQDVVKLRSEMDQVKTSLQQGSSLADNEKVWELTAGLLRFYSLIHDGVRDNFPQGKAENTAVATATDDVATAWFKKLHNHTSKHAPEDLDNILIKLTGQNLQKMGHPSFSIGQQGTLADILSSRKSFKALKDGIDVFMKDFGRTEFQKQFKLIYSAQTYCRGKWKYDPEFRTKIGLVGIGTGIATAAVFFGGPGALLGGLAAMAVGAGGEIGRAIYREFGAQMADSGTKMSIQTFKDIWSTAERKAAELAKISGNQKILLPLPSGTIIRIVTPTTDYNTAIIDRSSDAYTKPMELYQDIQMCRGKTAAEITAKLKNRTKTMVNQGPKGTGKTYSQKALINDWATIEASGGGQLIVVEFSADGIINDDMAFIHMWAEHQRQTSNGKFFYVKNFGEYELAVAKDPKVKNLLLKEFERDREEGHAVISFATTNKTDKKDDDITRAGRAFEFQTKNPSWETRRNFFDKHLKERLYFTPDSAYYRTNNISQHYATDLNALTTLSDNASMAQLNQIIGNLDTQRGRGAIITPALIEKEILREVYYHKNNPDGDRCNPAVAAHYAGQCVALLQAANEAPFLQGTSIAIASAETFETELDPTSRVRTDTTGRLILSSATGNKNEKNKLKQLAAGYLAQEILIKNPHDRDAELIKRDRIALREACEKYVTPGYDLQKMPEAKRNEFYKKISDEIDTIEAEVRAELTNKTSAPILHKTAAHIAKLRQINALEYFALRRLLAGGGKKNDSEASEHRATKAAPSNPQAAPQVRVAAAAAHKK